MSKNKQGFVFITGVKNGGGNRVSITLAESVANAGYNVILEYPNDSAVVSSFFAEANLPKHCNGKLSNNVLGKIWNIFLMLMHIRKHYSKDEWLIVYSGPIIAIFAFMLRKFNRIHFVQADDYNLFDNKSNGIPTNILLRKIILSVYKFLFKQTCNRKDVLYLFNSDFSYQAFTKISKLKNIIPHMVYPSVDIHSFYNLSKRKTGTFSIITVGRKVAWKGFKYFIQAVHELRNLIAIDNVYVLSQDDLSDYDLEDIKLIRPKNDEEINFYYNKADIYVCTSLWEGFGLPPLEAMATGCCAIISDIDGAKEYGINDKNCLMYEAGNVKELNQRILELYYDRSKLKALATEGFLTAQHFSPYQMTKDFLRIVISRYQIK